MKMQVRLTGERNDILAGLLKEVAIKLNYAVAACKGPFLTKMGPIIHDLLVDSPEGQSLLSGSGGSLHGQLGLTDPQRAIREISEAITRGIDWQLNQFTSTRTLLKGGLDVGILSESLVEVMGLSVGSFKSERGYDVNWLKWLLELGTVPIVRGHVYSTNTAGHRSRTGLGVMLTVKGAQWSVPAQFAGNLSNNWLTRAIEKLPPLAEKVLGPLLEAQLDG